MAQQASSPPRAGARPHRLARVIGLVLAAFVLVEGLLVGLGLLLTRVLERSSLAREELEFERTIVAERTPLWDQVTHYGTLLGSTVVVVALTAVGCLLLARLGRGPRLPVFLAVAVAGQTALFLLASMVVDRNRPPIPQLDVAPPTSSFPSGHTAATIALTCGLAFCLARTRARPPAPGPGLVPGRGPAGVRPAQSALPGHALADRRRCQRRYALVWLLLLRAILLPRAVADRPTGPRGPEPP